jgi:hypothetical protein
MGSSLPLVRMSSFWVATALIPVVAWLLIVAAGL